MRVAKRNDAINGVRGMAVLAILAHHYLPPDFFSFNIAKVFNSLIITVGAYFFGSAMLGEQEALQGTFGARAGAVVRLLWRQALRVWPMIWVMVTLYVALAVVDQGPLTTQIFRTWWLYAFGMGDVPKWIYGDQAFPAHFWTIAAQDQVILLLGLVMAAVGLKGLRRALPWLIAIGFLARTLGAALLMPEHPSWALETPLAVLDVAGLGVLARLSLEAPGQRNRLRQGAYTAALLAGLIWMILPNFNPVFYGLIPFALTLLSLGFVLTATDPLRSGAMTTSIVANAWFAFFGRIGLSLFFIHPFINTLLTLGWARVTGSAMPWWTLVLVGPPFAIAAAWLLHVGVELPIVKLRRRATVHPATAPALT